MRFFYLLKFVDMLNRWDFMKFKNEFYFMMLERMLE